MDLDPESTLEFTDISSLYNANKPLQVSFRYPTTFRGVKNNDRICLVQEGAVTIDQSLASVKVGHPSGHWLDDQGRYKYGKVVLDVSKLELSSDESRYMLLYVGKLETGSEQVLSRSNVFTVCSKDSILNGYSCLSLEDQLVLVDKVPDSFESPEVQSNISSFNLNYSPAQPSSSFVVVNENDSHKQESEVLSVLEDVELKSESSDESIPEDFENVLLAVTVSKQSSLPVPLLIESEPWTQLSEMGESSKPISISDRPIPKVRTKLKEKATNTESKEVPRETNEVGVQVDSPQPPVDKMGVSSTDLEFELLSSPERNTPVDMSASVNFGANLVSQREARMFKNANKEQRLKLKKLTSRMEEMKKEIEMLKEKLELQKDVDVHIVHDLEKQLERIKKEKEIISHQFTKEKGSLEEKAIQLQLECSTLFERCTSLLAQLQEKETESTILTSENLVLREKVKHLEEKLRNVEHRHHKKEREQETRKSKPREKKEPVVRDPYKPQPQSSAKKVTDIPVATTVTDKLQDYPTVEVIPQRNRPTDLPLSGNDKVKPVPQRKLAPVPTKNSSHSSSSTRHSERPRPQAMERSNSGRSHPDPHRDLQAVPNPKPTTNEAKSQRSQHSHHSIAKKTDTQSRSSPKISQDTTQTKTAETQGESLSEERIEEIASQLRGAPVVVCPVCQKILHARENDYAVLLHVEYCLRAQN